jgi:hypothetical protein
MTGTAPSVATFDPDGLGALPDPVARWLRWAIPAGAPLARSAVLSMRGEIRIGAWRPFTAEQVLVPGVGFVWAATASVGPLRVRGSDRYVDGEGAMDWRVAGIVPVLRASSPDVSRSAAGRLAGELVLVPPAALAAGVRWTAVDACSATATVDVDGHGHQVTITVDDDGCLRSVHLPRWGNPDKGPYAEHTFGVFVDQHHTFDGYRVPAELRAGWWPGTDRWADGEFYRCTITAAVLR